MSSLVVACSSLVRCAPHLGNTTNRDWWPGSAEDLHFRGLQVVSTTLGGSPMQRIYVVYTIDCERMADPEHQELVRAQT
jgi:hypothetical protein